MVIRKKTRLEKQVIDISGPDGNAFVLIGTARRFAQQIGLDHKQITEEMMSGDYQHLIETFDKYFGDIVDLVTEEEIAPPRGSPDVFRG